MHSRPVDITGMKVLIVDDAPANISLLSQALDKKGYSISVATNGQEGINLANKIHPDIILLDVMMPGLDGFETCQRLKESETMQDIPIIFITAVNDHKSILKGFSVGGVDYITKPIVLNEVLARVETHLKLKKVLSQKDQLIAELQDTNELLEKSATIDVLTGLPNRRCMMERLENEIARLNDPDATFSICHANLCRFQSINNFFGTYVGDQVFCSIAQFLQDNLRAKDLVGRWDGSEFMIIFPDTGLNEAQLIVDDLKSKFQNERLSFDGNSIETPMKFAISNITKNQDDLELCLKKLSESREHLKEDWEVTLVAC